MSTATTPPGRSTLRAAAATRSVALVTAGVLTGAVGVILFLDVGLGHSAALYTQYRQATTGPLTRALPPVGVLALAAAVGAALPARGRGRACALAAAACLLAGLILTVVVLFPINDEVLLWSAASPPTDWQAVRDRWQAVHAARCLLSLCAFVLLTTANGTEHGPTASGADPIGRVRP